MEKILSQMYRDGKFEYNKKLITKINNKNFKQSDFDKIAGNTSNMIILKSINDDKKFTSESIKILYTIPKNSFSLIADQNNDIYLAKILNLYEQSIKENSSDYINYQKQANISMRDNIFSSFDIFLNDKYEVIINQKTLDRVKNFFK